MRLYFHYFSMHLKTCMAHKKSFFLYALGQFLTSFTEFLALWFLLDRFKTVGGYTIGECALCFGVMVMSFSLMECFFRGFDHFAALVRSADFDRLLVRPRGLVFQVLCHKVEFGRLGKLVQSTIALGVGIALSPIEWSFARAGVLILMIAGGTIVFAGIAWIYAGLCFFTLEGLECVNVFLHGARDFGKYPLDVYGKALLRFCTFVIPYALFQYYPLTYLLGRSNDPFRALAPLGTPLFLIPCAILWTIGVKKYKSAGS